MKSIFLMVSVLFCQSALSWNTVNSPANVSNLLIDNTVATNASISGAGSSISKAGSVSTIEATKSPTLSIQGTTVDFASNASSGNASGSASANSQIAGTASMNYGVAKGLVGVNINANAGASTNQSSQTEAGGRATVSVTNVNGVLTDTKTAIGQITGTGNGTNGGSALSGATLTNIACPKLPNLGF